MANPFALLPLLHQRREDLGQCAEAELYSDGDDEDLHHSADRQCADAAHEAVEDVGVVEDEDHADECHHARAQREKPAKLVVDEHDVDDAAGPDKQRRGNGCDGKGTRTSFRLAPHEGDVLPVEALLAVYDKAGPPFALVTPDGRWVERGRMLMFGMAVDEKDKDSWKDDVRAILEANKGCTAIVVDCHC